MSATVLETSGVTQIDYRIVGELEAVLWEIQRLLTAYAAQEYGTHVHWLDQEVDGSYMARVSRSKDNFGREWSTP
jgi:hypothetical protein